MTTTPCTTNDRSDTGVISDQPSAHDHDNGHDDDEGVVDAQDHPGGSDSHGNGDGLSNAPEVPAVELSTATRGGGGNIPVAAAPSVMTSGGGGGKGSRIGEPVEVGPEVLGRWFDLLAGYGDLVRPTICALSLGDCSVLILSLAADSLQWVVSIHSCLVKHYTERGAEINHSPAPSVRHTYLRTRSSSSKTRTRSCLAGNEPPLPPSKDRTLWLGSLRSYRRTSR